MNSRKTFVYGTINEALKKGDVDYIENLLSLGFDWIGERYIDLHDIKYPSDPDKFAKLCKYIFDLKLYDCNGSFSSVSYCRNEDPYGEANVVNLIFYPDINHFDNISLSEKNKTIAYAFKNRFIEWNRKQDKNDNLYDSDYDDENCDPGIVIYVNDHNSFGVSIVDNETWMGGAPMINKWTTNINIVDLLELLRSLHSHLHV